MYMYIHFFKYEIFPTAPKLKGRPRKRKKIKRPGSPESVSSSESSASTSHSVSTQASTKVCISILAERVIPETRVLPVVYPGEMG